MSDLSITHGLNAWATRHDGVEDGISAYASASEALFLMLVVVLFVVVWGRMRTLARRAAVAAAASAGIALLIGQVLSHLVDRPRPFVAHPGLIRLFAPHAADASFPSDHATASFAIAAAIMLRNRVWGSFALVAAALLGRQSRRDRRALPARRARRRGARQRRRARALRPGARDGVTDRVADTLGGAFDAARAARRRAARHRSLNAAQAGAGRALSPFSPA